MEWTFVYLMFGLKLPIAGLLWIVWWAIHQVPEDATPGGEGSKRPRHPHPRPPLPRRPRPRGSHGLPIPAPPQRMRFAPPRPVPAMRHKQQQR